MHRFRKHKWLKRICTRRKTNRNRPQSYLCYALSLIYIQIQAFSWPILLSYASPLPSFVISVFYFSASTSFYIRLERETDERDVCVSSVLFSFHFFPWKPKFGILFRLLVDPFGKKTSLPIHKSYSGWSHNGGLGLHLHADDGCFWWSYGIDVPAEERKSVALWS